MKKTDRPSVQSFEPSNQPTNQQNDDQANFNRIRIGKIENTNETNETTEKITYINDRIKLE